MDNLNHVFLQKCQQEYISQIKRCNYPSEAADRVFLDILDQLEGTVFYHEHNLQGVKTLEDFKLKVPIRSYQEFDYYIDLQLKGAQNILSKSNCFAFYKTSGTSGKSKYIPSTYHWRQEYRGPALYAQWGLYFKLINAHSLEAGNVLDISWSRKKTKIDTGLPIYSITSRPSALDGNDWNPPWHDSEWFFSEESEGHSESLLNMLVSTATNPVKIIVSVNPSKIVSLYEAININRNLFIEKLNQRKSSEKRLAVKEQLELLINRILNKKHINLLDLWPNLNLLVCWRSASAAKYMQWLSRAAADVPVVPFSTVGTEGIVTIPVDSSATGGALGINQGIFEFVDIDTLEDRSVSLAPDQTTLNFDQVEVGKSYRLVMTQANGIYRYDTHDVYRVAGWAGKTPRIEFVGRSNVGSSFTGEKLTEDNIYQAVKIALNSVCQQLPFFSCIPVWGNPPGYVLAVEASEIGLVEQCEEIEEQLQQALCKLNEEYKDKCTSARLQKLSLLLLKPGAFSDINKINIESGISSAQVKHLWIQSNDKLLSLFNSYGLVLKTELEHA